MELIQCVFVPGSIGKDKTTVSTNTIVPVSLLELQNSIIPYRPVYKPALT